MSSAQKQGFSLVEILVFITILSVFFVVAVSVSIASIKYMKINEHKILATRYAEDALEWLRGEKDKDWDTFVTYASTFGTTYCFNNPVPSDPSVSLNSISSGITCNKNGITGHSPQIFKREVTLTTEGSGSSIYQVHVSIKVSWDELGTEYSVPIDTVFSVWE